MSKIADRIIELEEQLDYHNKQYRLGLPIISDQEYDQLEEELKQLDSESEWFKRGVQDAQPISRKEKLPYKMNSLDKCKNLDEVKEWLLDEVGYELCDKVQLVITPKLDGLSVLQDAHTGKSYTRGDGIVGQNCSSHMKIIEGPDSPEPGPYVRGEVVFQNWQWKEFFEANPQYKNPRNSAVGLINGDYDPLKPYHLLSYLCYEVLGVDWSKSRQLDWLGQSTIHGFSLPYWITTAEALTEKHLEGLFFLWAEKYPIDGLVIDVNEAKYRIRNEANGNPAYARAYKHPNFSEKAKTVIKSIERNINRHGVITPVCILEPRQLAGAEIKRANGISMSYLYDWGLMPGTEITVVRSGEVIPKIIEVNGIAIPFKEEFKTDKEYKEKYKLQLQARQNQLQSVDNKISGEMETFMDDNCNCPFCKSTLAWDKTMTNMVCQNQNCEEINIQKLSDFFKICGIEEFKETTFRQLYKEGWRTPEQVLNIDQSQLLALEGWGFLSAMKFICEMDKLKYEGIPFARFLHATSLFGGMGEKTLQLILDNIELADFTDLNIPYVELTKIHGIGETNAKTFLYGWDKFWSSEMSPHTLVKFSSLQSPKPNSGIMNGTIAVFSGFRDNELKIQLEQKGAIVEDNFTKKTNLLIVKDKTQTTSKMKKAEEQGTAVYTREELINKLKTM